MKKIMLLIPFILVFCFYSFSTSASHFSTYEQTIQDLLIQAAREDIVVSDVYYKANKDKDPSTFVKLADIKGYKTDDVLAESGGKYTLEKMMTYKEYIDLCIDPGVSYDIDPDRMVWVITSEFSEPHNINGIMVQNAVVTTAWDAETGAAISLTVNTTDKNFSNEILKTRPPIH